MNQVVISEASERIKKLLSGIQSEAEQLLIVHELYEISNYGWADHDTPDPDHAGHAVFQVSPPFEPDWEALLNGGLVSYIPSIKDEALLRAGEDFMGTMISAPRSIRNSALLRSSQRQERHQRGS